MTEIIKKLAELVGEYPGIPFGEMEEALKTPIDSSVPHGVFNLNIAEVNQLNETLMQQLRENPELVLVAGFDNAGFRFIKIVPRVEELDFMRMEIDDALIEVEQNERAFHAGVHGDGTSNTEFKKGIVKPPILKVEVVE